MKLKKKTKEVEEVKSDIKSRVALISQFRLHTKFVYDKLLTKKTMKNLRKKTTGILGILVAAMLFVSCSNEIVETTVEPDEQEVVVVTPVDDSFGVKSSEKLENPFLIKKLTLKLRGYIESLEETEINIFEAIDIDNAVLTAYSHTEVASVTIPVEEGLSFVISATDRDLVGEGVFIKVEHKEFFSTVTFYDLDFEILGGIETKGVGGNTFGIASDGLELNNFTTDDITCILTTPECAAGLVVDLTDI